MCKTIPFNIKFLFWSSGIGLKVFPILLNEFNESRHTNSVTQ